jgi:hypothetical protein
MTDIAAPIPITDLEALRARGITYPATVDAWRWAFRHRDERGLKDAFVRVGRRVCVLPDRYVTALRARAGQ